MNKKKKSGLSGKIIDSKKEKKDISEYSREKYISLAFLFFLVLYIIITRLHTCNEPQERDITTYAVIGHEILSGRELYSDLWDHKPPAIYFTYILGELICGYGPWGIYFINVLATVITLLGVYHAGSLYGKKTGLWAAALWAIISGDMMLQANQPNVEVFLNAAIIWSFALIVRAEPGNFPLWKAIVTGLIMTLASLYKQVVIPTFFFFALVHIFYPSGLQKNRGKAVKDVLIMIFTGSLIWISIILYFVITDRFKDFYDAIFTYNRFYGGGILESFFQCLNPARFFHPYLLFTLPMFIITFISAGTAVFKAPGRAWFLLVAYMLGTYLSVSLPGKFYPHYYQLWLPLLSVGVAWSSVLLAKLFKSDFIISILCCFFCLFLFIRALPSYRLSPEEWTRKKLPVGESFIQSYELAGEIDHLLEPDETFYQWGGESALYFASGRKSPSGVIYIYPLFEGPLMKELTERLINDLEREKPSLIVINKRYAADGYNKNSALQWIGKYYEPLPVNPDRGLFFLMVRKGSELEKRLLLQLQAD